MKNRLELAAHFNELGFKVGAEIGVFDGYFSEVLCQSIPGLKLYSIDSWEVYAEYRNSNYKDKLRIAYETAQERLSKFDCEIIKKFSMDAVKDFKDESLDFVYIDANHEYTHVQEDIREWSKKVRIGGIVSGDDYYITPKGNEGVINAVNEYVKEHGYELHLTEANRHGSYRDNWQPSWWFVKEAI